MRPPAVPLINVDPYFAVWSEADHLNDDCTRHWTNKPNTINGIANIDGTDYVFMGDAKQLELPKIKQTNLDVNALSTTYTFVGAGIVLTAKFTTPALPDDLMLYSRPLTYLLVTAQSQDGKTHKININLSVSEEICLNEKGQDEVSTEKVDICPQVKSMRMGSLSQKILNRAGDDLRIDWGYFYLSVAADNSSVTSKKDDMTWLVADAHITTEKDSRALFTFAYDDIYAIEYFHQKLEAYWKKDGSTIQKVIADAYTDYDALMERADQFSDDLFCKATRAGGEKYAEMLELAYRQVVGAHKCVTDTDGKVLYISKECFSNGCAATVDVSYPSIPMFLYYNPELVRGMARPIFKYADSEVWPFDFAPHDVGTYPLLNGQSYSNGTDPQWQMPVEECGNMLVMVATSCIVDNDVSFAKEHHKLLKTWADYLLGHGLDPENQLCTDDFAGHLAHNCNLSLKAIMALASYGIIENMMGDKKESDKYMDAARDMAQKWVTMADNGDGSYRLAFDQPDTFSMKYNMVWDVLFGTELFPRTVINAEFMSYKRHMDKYGMPLDNRSRYTKSDWLVWTGTLSDSRDGFEAYVNPLWSAYHCTETRVPMTDWYYTVTSQQKGFQHRSVQGGLFIKLLEQSGKCKIKK